MRIYHGLSSERAKKCKRPTESSERLHAPSEVGYVEDFVQYSSIACSELFQVEIEFTPR